MKLNKLIAGAAALALSGALAWAQNVGLHGYMDYTNFGAAQEFNFDGNPSDVFAEFGSFYNGRTELNANVSAANFEFNVGVRLGAGGNSWYNLYWDVTQTETDADGNETGYTPSAIHQMNMRIGFFNDQLQVYTGRFEEWNAGYVFNGYQLGGQPITELANRGSGQYFTGLECAPFRVPGLKVLVGLPILPINGNGVQTWYAGNDWKNLYKKVMFRASYAWLRQNIIFNAGFRPGTYFTGMYDYDKKDGATTNYFMEGYLQADMPSLVPGVKLNATYDFRGRKNETVGKFTTAHYLGISGMVDPMLLPTGLNITFENRFAYADDHYTATNEKFIYDKIGVGGRYSVSGTPYVVGLNLSGAYAQDANGTSFPNNNGLSYDNAANTPWLAAYDITTDWIVSANNAGSGAPGRYWGAYAYPYFEKPFANGFFQIGVEVQFSQYHVTSTTQNLTYRVPVKFCFWF